MFKIGSHLSTSKGYLGMGKEAVSIGANTFQFFTRNPRGGKAKAFDVADAQAYNAFAAEHGLTAPLAHAPYTLNPCSDKEENREFARMVFRDDIFRLDHFARAMYNFHPGSHVKQGTEIGIAKIIDVLGDVLDPSQKTLLLLEAMAGKGTEVGGSFEELRAIIDGVEHKHLLGVCIDTCHIFDGGYDIVNDLDGVLTQFDNIVGLERLKAIHLNDSKNPLGSRKDRHEKIGHGHIGIEAFARIINHPKLRELPFYLETPHEDVAGYAEEIALLKSHRV